MIVLGTATHKARKEHWCDSCNQKIAPETIYYRARCVDCGDAWTFKAHLPCKQAAEFLAKHGIEGEDGALISVIDMDNDDMAMIAQADPSLFQRVWPNTMLRR